MSAPPETPRCPVCAGALAPAAEGAWCPCCALGAELEPPGAEDTLFTVPGHVVLAELGRGAAGIVYRARQEQPDREVALKILRPHELGSAESLARFRLEAATVAALDHPVILPVLSVGEHAGLPYFTMKLCAGSLAERLAGYRGRWRQMAELLAVVAEAVHHAHSRGVLHRDLKPGNVLFDEADRPFISDFGLAKLIEGPGKTGPATRPLLVMGTPGYLAPEVLAGGAGAATMAADVFALGAILHELLTGSPPPAAQAAEAPRPGVPRDLAVICAHALAAGPDRRYPTAEALAADLRAWLAGRPIAARPVSAWGRGWSWARRNPVLAAMTLILALTLAGGTTVLVLKNRALRMALAEAQAAEARSQASLAESLLAQAQAVRQSGQEGQRNETLKLLGRAARITATDTQRDEAATALLLPDWNPTEELKPWVGDSVSAVPTPDFSACLVEDTARNFSLRDVVAGTVRWTWSAPSTSSSLPVFSPDGRWVALHFRNDEVQVLATADGRPALHLTGRPYAFKGSVWMFGKDLDFSPDGSLLAVARPEGGVSFHRPEGGEPVRVWAGTEWITTMQFSPDGTRLAVGGGRELKDSLIAVIEVATARVLVQEKPPRRVEFTAWSEDGRWLALRAAGGNAEVRAARDLKVRAVLPDRAALHGKFLPDGNRLMLTQQLSATRLWHIDSATLLLAKVDGGRPGNWWSVAPLRQWRSYSAGPVHLTRFMNSPILQSWATDEHDYTVPEIGWPAERSADGRYLAMGGWSGGLVWDLTTGRLMLRVKLTEASDAGGVRFDPAGGALWVSLKAKGLWRVPVGGMDTENWVAGEGEPIDAEPGFYLTASNRPSGRLALLNPVAGEVKIIDTRTRRVSARWLHDGATRAEFSPDGQQLVVNGSPLVGSGPGAPATVYTVATGEVVRVLGSQPGRLARWSPGGKWVLAADGKESTKLWRAGTWEPGPKLPPDTQGWQSPAAFSADDRILLLRSSDDFQLFDTMTAITEFRLPPPQGGDYTRLDLGFAGDQRFWTLSLDGRLDVWDLAAVRRELAAIGLGAASGK